MRECLRKMRIRNLLFINILLLLVILLSQGSGWYLILLTVAQLIFVPSILHLLREDFNKVFGRILPYSVLLSSIAVFFLYLVQDQILIFLLSSIYLLFTCLLAIGGIKRFVNRGFIYFEEFLIDIGLIYLAIGGAWFFAYQVKLDVGFSPMITWLTSIHFHYSAFLFPVFLGLLGRVINSNRLYIFAGMIIIISPWIVALGITFSVFIEVLSVILYIVGIYISVYFSIKAPISSNIQRVLINLSFGALGISILFSLIYAFGNFTGLYSIGIDRMIESHGLINAVLFAFIGLIGWSIYIPNSRVTRTFFPVSQIKGKLIIGEKILEDKRGDYIHNGLVDRMEKFFPVEIDSMANNIQDFYENTNDYELFAEVKWSKWFLPFAAIYRLISRTMKQINLPLSRKQIEMTGRIIDVEDSKDGRENVRAWIRKIKSDTVFVALYSEHETSGVRYLNIALPLPRTTMTGVLALQQQGNGLSLTSKKLSKDSDAGIYLTIGKSNMKLPLEEQFDIKQLDNGCLQALHQMWIFSLPFLRIKYEMKKKENRI